MAADERNYRTSGMTGVSVFTELQIHSPRQHSSLSIVASPLIFLSPGFAVILSNIFTLSVPLSLSENKARHRPTASSERCHHFFSRAFLAAMGQFIHVFVFS